MAELFLIIVVIATIASGDYTFLWIIGGIIVVAILAACFGKNKTASTSQLRPRLRVDHPHCINDDDYECSICGARFSRDMMTCPHCGVRFSGKQDDWEEFDEEEDELEAWDEEEGL